MCAVRISVSFDRSAPITIAHHIVERFARESDEVSSSSNVSASTLAARNGPTGAGRAPLPVLERKSVAR